MFEPAFLATWGLAGLFAAAFLSGSVVPLPSEAVLIALLHGGVEAPPAVAVATAGNVLGASTLYLLGGLVAGGSGGRAGRWLLRNVDPVRLEKAKARIRRWGAPALLMSWLPIVGDVFVVAAGFAGVRPLAFVVFTAGGKALRYTIVASSAAALLAA